MARALPLSLALLLATGVAWGAGTELEKAYGLDAPLLEVDRFSDAAGTLLRRSVDPRLPGPNQPIHLDDERFALEVEAPDGSSFRCYDLDVRPAHPGRFYVFYDEQGNYQLGQYPVIDRAPGDAGYSDLWDIWKVRVPLGFRANNALRDLAAVERLLADPRSGYTAERSGALLNGPVVPEGSSADSKAELRKGRATIQYAWYRGKRAPFLYLEEHLRIQGEDAPVSTMKLAKTLPREKDARSLRSAGPLRISALPGQQGYSPLHRLESPGTPPPLPGPLNCPIVPAAGPPAAK